MKSNQLFVLILVLTACGSQPGAQGIDALSAVGSGETSQSTRGEKGDKGEDGKDGKDGVDGKTGKDGIDGVEGTAGIDGASGASGVAGVNGATGQDGQDGASADSLNVVDASGTVIGQFYGLDKTTSEYWVVKGVMRFQIARVDGTFPQGWVFYSGANCTGTKRVGIINGQFANVVMEPETGKILKAKGLQINNFAYASRRGAANCANLTSTANRVFDFDEQTSATLGFTYPVNGPEVGN